MTTERHTPPPLAQKILNWIMPHPRSISLLGDYEEIFIRKVKQQGVLRARMWYWFEVFRSLLPFLSTTLIWRFIMSRKYLKVAYRNIQKNKVHSLINIVGLAIGLTCVFLVLFWVRNELSFDRFHQNRSSIYRLTSRMTLNDREREIASTPGKWGEFLKNEFPYISDAVRIRQMKRNLFEYNDIKLMESGGIYADGSLLDIFSFPLIERGGVNPLTDPNDMIITQSMAEKYFRLKNPIGKTVNFAGRPYIIRGILADIPPNSHLRFDFICAMSGFNRQNIDWYSDYFTTYILADKAITNDMKDNINNSLIEKVPLFIPYRLKLKLQPLPDVYLKSRHLSGNEGRFGDINHIYVFLIVAVLILIIAAVNYINITTAFSEQKTTGIGIRKAFGATRRKLFHQFMTEGLFLVSISVILSIGFAALLLPFFNTMTGREITLDFFSGNTILFIIAVGVTIGLIAGAYPALYLSSLNPRKALFKERLSAIPGRSFIRKLLMTFQFFIAVFIICCTMAVISQLYFITHKNLGFKKDNVIAISIHGDISNQYPALRNSLTVIPGVVDVTAKSSPLIDDNDGGPVGLHHPLEGAPMMRYAAVDYNYFDLLDIPLLEGSTFRQDSKQTEYIECIVNLKVLDLLNIKNPIGKILVNSRNQKLRVIGTVANANFYSLRGKLNPRIFTLVNHNQISQVLVRLKGPEDGQSLQQIRSVFRTTVRDFPFEYQFLDDTYARLYQKEKRLGSLLNGFSILAIFISCLGLFGLVSYTVERKKREIGIRKTLGASSAHVVKMIMGDFIPYVLLGFVLASPLAYHAINIWLNGFANRITPGPLIFAVSGIIVILIALVTIGLKSAAAAGANPVESIRYE